MITSQRSGTVLPVAHTTLKACYSPAMKMGEILGDAIVRVEAAVVGISGQPQARWNEARWNEARWNEARSFRETQQRIPSDTAPAYNTIER